METNLPIIPNKEFYPTLKSIYKQYLKIYESYNDYTVITSEKHLQSDE